MLCLQDNETSQTGDGVSANGNVSITKTYTSGIALFPFQINTQGLHQPNRLTWVLVLGLKLTNQAT